MRVEAVRAGTFVIYPCPHADNADGLEARYIDTAHAKCWAPHDRYLDYGRAEALGYARFAAALGAEARLAPLTLASADPPAFWAAVLRIEAFVGASSLHWLPVGSNVYASMRPSSALWQCWW